VGTVQELKRWLYEEAPDTGASRGFFGFLMGGTCDGEGKTHHRSAIPLPVRG
jgi:hypothetical protein